jgi:phosphoribosyl 1,2-cyclic phosphodiesterase
MGLVKAVFVSHEHSDHITGIPGISKKYRLPVYITSATLRGSNIPIEKSLLRSFAPETTVDIDGLQVIPFRKSHDAADPHSFVVTDGTVRIGVFTDIGYTCQNTIKFFSQCHAAFLESNYCPDMLAKGNYPYYLKQRITGRQGHLSNSEALDLFLSHRGEQLSHLLLAHLSRNNNSPETVTRLFSPHAGQTQIIIASRHNETPVFCIDGSFRQPRPSLLGPSPTGSLQLSLFQ